MRRILLLFLLPLSPALAQVNPGNQYATGVYPASGSTIGGAAANYLLPPGLTTTQIDSALSVSSGSFTIQNGDAHTPFDNPNNVKIDDERTDVSPVKRSAKEWGVQCDLRNIYGTVTQGSNTVTIIGGYTALFSNADIGKTLAVVGFVDGVQTAFEPTIGAITDSYHATFANSLTSPFTVSSTQAMDLGHDDTGEAETWPLAGGSGLAGAIDAADYLGYTLTIPSGLCLTHTQTFYPNRMEGMAASGSIIVGFPGEDVFSGGDLAFNANLGDFAIDPDDQIDPTQPWQIVTAAPNYPGADDPTTARGTIAEWDCSQCTWMALHAGGAGEIYINGFRQHFISGNLSVNFGSPTQPVMNYSSYSVFNDVAGIWNGGPLGNVYGSNGFLNWGISSVANGPIGTQGGSTQQQVSYGCGRQPILGQTNETFNTGNLTAPYVNSNSGLICPDEFNQNGDWEVAPFGAWTFDSTSPVSQGYVPCSVGTNPNQYYCGSYVFDGVGGVYIGPGQRLAAGKYIATISVKGSLPSNNFPFALSATGLSGVYESVPVTNSWTSYSFPVDFTGAAAGAMLSISVNGASTADTIDLGYLDFAPVPQALALQQSTPADNAPCVPGQILGSNFSYLYICTASGTVKRATLSSY